MLREMGYSHIQSTKPDTVGFGLNDSPTGLAAYILEKFTFWVNRDSINRADGGLTDKFTLDELLTNVMIYWVTGSATTSCRLYKESKSYHVMNELKFMSVVVPPSVPIGFTIFPHEIYVPPRSLLTDTYQNITRYTHMPRGGHFGVFEEPQLMADEIRAFVRTTL